MFNKQCSVKNKETSVQVSDTTMSRRDKKLTNKKVLKSPFRDLGLNKVGGLEVEKYFCKPLKLKA